MKTGTANLPLHRGKAPRWLFKRMTHLAREITLVILEEFDTREVLNRLSDPFWFQSLGCVLGFDWHSSGVTTTTCGALKEALKGLESETGLYVAGGKGGTSRRTPKEILDVGEKLQVNPEDLVYASRMSAKVDSAGLQDGYQIYQHSFFFDQLGNWTVVQQGMNEDTRYARRYHWTDRVLKDFVCEPHAAVCCDRREEALNMVARESAEARSVSTILAQEPPDTLLGHIKHLQELHLPKHHEVRLQELNPSRLQSILVKTYEKQPQDFQDLLGMPGVGAKTIRSLSLIAELVYGVDPSFRDPVRYSFAHGGKDGHPYPVDRTNYDRSIQILSSALERARIGDGDRLAALRRLGRMMGEPRQCTSFRRRSV
jgi:hypothetical protein